MTPSTTAAATVRSQCNGWATAATTVATTHTATTIHAVRTSLLMAGSLPGRQHRAAGKEVDKVQGSMFSRAISGSRVV